MSIPQYIVDDKGERVSVILPIKEYEKLLEDLEELEDVRLYDEAVADNEPSMTIDEAFRQIEAKRESK